MHSTLLPDPFQLDTIGLSIRPTITFLLYTGYKCPIMACCDKLMDLCYIVMSTAPVRNFIHDTPLTVCINDVVVQAG